MTIQKDIQSVNDKAASIKQQIVLLINSLPDNPKITRLSTKVNCFVMRSSDLRDCLSPEYHDFRCQCRALCDALNKHRMEEVIPLIQKVIDKGYLRLSSQLMKFHPTVIQHLKEILLM